MVYLVSFPERNSHPALDDCPLHGRRAVVRGHREPGQGVQVRGQLVEVVQPAVAGSAGGRRDATLGGIDAVG